MRVVAWLRASQALLFEASLAPAIVGTAAAIRGGARLDGLWLGLILASLVGIQAGANLFKAHYEGRDRTGPPASRGSWLAFDSGVASDLGLDSDSVLRVGYACFAVGVVAGLALVLLSRNLLLLAFGLAGALLAWSYSSPPLKLSYRGIGEVSTFLAFGPIMTIGATVAFGGAGMFASVLASIVLGFLAAAISFARYFPNRGEDAAKGKRTPVVRLSPHAARSFLVGLVFAPVVVAILWIPFVGGFLWVVVLLVCLFVLIRLFPASPTGRFGRIIAVAIATHTLVAAALVTDLLFRL